MSESNRFFVGLVISISASAWQGLGKIKNHLTGKVEKNLEHARGAIDLLEMLKEKTKNNLNAEEEKVLLTTIADLQLNYVEELNRDKKDGETGAGEVNVSDDTAAENANQGGGSS